MKTYYKLKRDWSGLNADLIGKINSKEDWILLGFPKKEDLWFNDPYWFEEIKLGYMGEPTYTTKEMINLGKKVAEFFGHFYPVELSEKIFREFFKKDKR